MQASGQHIARDVSHLSGCYLRPGASRGLPNPAPTQTSSALARTLPECFRCVPAIAAAITTGLHLLTWSRTAPRRGRSAGRNPPSL